MAPLEDGPPPDHFGGKISGTNQFDSGRRRIPGKAGALDFRPVRHLLGVQQGIACFRDRRDRLSNEVNLQVGRGLKLHLWALYLDFQMNLLPSEAAGTRIMLLTE